MTHGNSAVSNTPLVGVVILNWNRADLTLDTLASLREQSYSRVLVLVLDNGSDNQEEALRLISTAFPHVQLWASKRNLGFAGGCNVGIRQALLAGADYILLLNNDVLLHPEAISHLVDALEADSLAAAAGPLIYYESQRERVWFGGGDVRLGARVIAEHGESLRVAPDSESQATGWLPGTAILARRSAVERAGPLDAAYFLYWEDVDWSMRLRQGGHRIVIVPRAVIWHKINASTGALPVPLSIVYYWERNRLRFIERWGGWKSLVWALSKVLWRSVAWRVRLPKDDPQAAVKLEAYRDYLLRRFGKRRG